MNSLSLTALLEAMPDIIVTLPTFGAVDLTRPILALLVFSILYGFFQVVQQIILVQLKKWASKTKTDIDNVVIAAVEGVRSWVYVVVALYMALQFFALPTVLDYIVNGTILFAIVWQVIEVISILIEFFTKRMLEKGAEGDEIDPRWAALKKLK
jgi:hypothetical protein